MEEEKIRKFHCSLETIQLLSETFFAMHRGNSRYIYTYTYTHIHVNTCFTLYHEKV